MSLYNQPERIQQGRQSQQRNDRSKSLGQAFSRKTKPAHFFNQSSPNCSQCFHIGSAPQRGAISDSYSENSGRRSILHAPESFDSLLRSRFSSSMESSRYDGQKAGRTETRGPVMPNRENLVAAFSLDPFQEAKILLTSHADSSHIAFYDFNINLIIFRDHHSPLCSRKC